MTVPVWVWLPGSDSPLQAGELTTDGRDSRFHYAPDYLAIGDAPALDPVELRLVRRARGIAINASDGLPGVIRDAKPAGYGADRLIAQAGTELTSLELLERGVPDGVGAIEVCVDLDKKLDWVPKSLEELKAVVEGLDAVAPASRALRLLNDDLGTSAGGERPKSTVVHDGRLWLAKLQDRGDLPAMPAREFVAMRLAHLAGIDVAHVELQTYGTHQVLLVERFDRAGDPLRPQRRLYASAHTVLQLSPSSVRGDVQRSYLNLGDRLRVWAKGQEYLGGQLRELWRRMAFNAVVGNVDDHPLNHGLLFDGPLFDGQAKLGWRLSPAFDITPILRAPPDPIRDGPALSLATGVDGGSLAGAERLVMAAPHFGVSVVDAQQWLHDTAALVSATWEQLLREAAAPVAEDAGRLEHILSDVRPAFAFAEWLAEHYGPTI